MSVDPANASSERPTLSNGESLNLAENNEAYLCFNAYSLRSVNPVDKLSNLITNSFWARLTRRIDLKGITRVFSDAKDGSSTSSVNRLYIPEADTRGWEYWSSIVGEDGLVSTVDENSSPVSFKVDLIRLPSIISPAYFKSIRESFGLLSLALEDNGTGELHGVPYVVPGGRFNEMYGWDSYFESLGLLADGNGHLAKAMVENFVFHLELLYN
jgi:alpha,alpha-trehalase